MKKLFSAAACAAVIGWAGSAMALPYYESYEGYQSVQEGDKYSFFFDLVYTNGPGTGTNAKGLTLKQDAASGPDAIFTSAYLDITLFSQDKDWEAAKIQLTAYNNGKTYTLYDGIFNATSNNPEQNFHFDLNYKSFLDDPWGKVTIGATVSWWDCNWNDFAITKVAMTGETAPVPEPTTMLLFGTGLAGLAAFGRRRVSR